MKLSAEIIHERMLSDLKSELSRFYREREVEYFRTFNQKLKTGIIDAHDPDYKNICLTEAENFASTASSDVLAFVKNYVLEAADTIICAKEEGIFDSQEAEIAFNFLKYILTAAEIENDPETKLPQKRR